MRGVVALLALLAGASAQLETPSNATTEGACVRAVVCVAGQLHIALLQILGPTDPSPLPPRTQCQTLRPTLKDVLVKAYNLGLNGLQGREEHSHWLQGHVALLRDVRQGQRCVFGCLQVAVRDRSRWPLPVVGW